MPNIVSFAASIAGLAHGEKSQVHVLTHSITHPAYLMPREPKRLRLGTKVCSACRQEITVISAIAIVTWCTCYKLNLVLLLVGDSVCELCTSDDKYALQFSSTHAAVHCGHGTLGT